MKSPLPCLLVLFALQASAFADPAGRQRLREVLAEHGASEPLVVLAQLAREGNFSLDEADVVAAATSNAISPALRTLLSNTRTIGVADGRLVLTANRVFEVPTQNGAALRFGKQVGVAPESTGRARVRGLQVGPQRFRDERNPVRAVLLDREGVYGLDMSTGSEAREVWFRPQVAEPAPAPPAPAPEPPAPPSEPIDAPSLRLPSVEQPRAETPAPAALPPVAPAEAPATPRSPERATPSPHPEQPLATPSQPTPPVRAVAGGEDRLRRIFGLGGEESGEVAPTALAAGSEGVAVRDLQRRLQLAGLELKADGKFGTSTTEALQRFQRERGLEPTGTLDASTDAALRRAARAPRVELGDEGVAAHRLQAALRRRGAELEPDGVFGAESVAALRAFQTENGLEATGVADAATWDRLETLRRGDRGDDVRDLQDALNRIRLAQGKSEVEVDGRFGAATEEALEELQGDLGEEASGQASPQLLASLRRTTLLGLLAEASRKEAAPGLSEGERGEPVRELQQELRRHGIPLDPDGHFGPATRAAVERFQRENELPVTGKADAATLNALHGLVRGDRGEDVKELQRLLNHQRRQAGLHEVPVDGRYGRSTAEAIAELQRDLDLEVTGRADKALIDALSAARAQDTTPILRPGDRGESVRRLQERLNAHREAAGLAKLHETGEFDAATVTALTTFQRERNLAPSGESDPATWARLDAQPPADVKVRPFRQGDQHDEVALLQDKLNQIRRWRGQRPIGVDGHFGAGTRRAFEGFQRTSGLDVTGQADAETVAALDRLTAGTYSGDFPRLARYAPFSEEARQLFTAAARLIGVPEAWAHSNGLHQILKRESDGWVGIPNYTYGRRKTDHGAWPSVHEELRRGRKRAKSSATGLGQLLLANVDKHYPQGRAGIGDPLNEAAGMLAYIRDRYRTPARAWSRYGKNHEGY